MKALFSLLCSALMVGCAVVPARDVVVVEPVPVVAYPTAVIHTQTHWVTPAVVYVPSSHHRHHHGSEKEMRVHERQRIEQTRPSQTQIQTPYPTSVEQTSPRHPVRPSPTNQERRERWLR